MNTVQMRSIIVEQTRSAQNLLVGTHAAVNLDLNNTLLVMIPDVIYYTIAKVNPNKSNSPLFTIKHLPII